MSGPPATSPSPGVLGKAGNFRVLVLLRHLCRLLLAVVFLMAAVTKITRPHDFIDGLILHSRLPLWLAWPAGVYLPWLELTCGFCLLLGVAQREAALLLSLLLVFFLAWPLFQQGSGECGCFLFPRALGPLNEGWGALLRNLSLLGCSSWLVLDHPRVTALPPTPHMSGTTGS